MLDVGFEAVKEVQFQIDLGGWLFQGGQEVVRQIVHCAKLDASKGKS